MKILQGAGIQPGQIVLEVGCGTGFFTIPAAQLVGDEGCLVAMDALSGFIKQVAKKEMIKVELSAWNAWMGLNCHVDR
jgi:demethylmenaquinone methyltransferase/2-methoxy-6-polyprenyl-1,4-benzoquinol methylase